MCTSQWVQKQYAACQLSPHYNTAAIKDSKLIEIVRMSAPALLSFHQNTRMQTLCLSECGHVRRVLFCTQPPPRDSFMRYASAISKDVSVTACLASLSFVLGAPYEDIGNWVNVPCSEKVFKKQTMLCPHSNRSNAPK